MSTSSGEGVPDRLPEKRAMPRDAGPQGAGAHVSVHAVLLHGGTAHFDDGAVHGASGVEAGISWTEESEIPAEAERWRVVWVAVDHGEHGTRRYAGLTVDEFLLDPVRRCGWRGEGYGDAAGRAAAGQVQVDALATAEREALRKILLEQDPTAWDDAAEAVYRALENPAGPPETQNRSGE